MTYAQLPLRVVHCFWSSGNTGAAAIGTVWSGIWRYLARFSNCYSFLCIPVITFNCHCEFNPGLPHTSVTSSNLSWKERASCIHKQPLFWTIIWGRTVDHLWHEKVPFPNFSSVHKLGCCCPLSLSGTAIVSTWVRMHSDYLPPWHCFKDTKIEESQSSLWIKHSPFTRNGMLYISH